MLPSSTSRRFICRPDSITPSSHSPINVSTQPLPRDITNTMVSKVLLKSTLIVWIWVYAISISTVETEAMVGTQQKDKSTHHSSKANEIEEEPLLSAHENIKSDKTTNPLPHFYGEKILLASKAVNRLIWYGPDEKFFE